MAALSSTTLERTCPAGKSLRRFGKHEELSKVRLMLGRSGIRLFDFSRLLDTYEYNNSSVRVTCVCLRIALV